MAGPKPDSRTMMALLWLRGIWEQTCSRILTPVHSCELSLSEWRGSSTFTRCDRWGTTWGWGPSLTMAAVRHGKLAEGIATSWFMAGKAQALILAISVWIQIYCLNLEPNPWSWKSARGQVSLWGARQQGRVLDRFTLTSASVPT